MNGRPRKTQEELDREMEDYWENKEANCGGNGESKKEGLAAEPGDDDIDMVT